MDLNWKNMKKIMLLIAFAIALFLGMQNIKPVVEFLQYILRIAYPFLVGLCIAFILNVPMRFIENKLFGVQKLQNNKIVRAIKRPASLLLTLLFVTGLIFVVIFLILPELGHSLSTFANYIPGVVGDIQKWIEDLWKTYPQLSEWVGTLEINWQNIANSALGFVQNLTGSLLDSTISVASGVIGSIINFFIGFVFALYILCQKEKLGYHCRKVITAYARPKWAERIFKVTCLANDTFSNFLSGQCFEAVILGTMFFLAMTMFRFPYALMISVFIGFMALIPMFGAMIGIIIGAFLILIVNPGQMLWFLLLAVVLQQIEGNFIYPHVVGNSVGLPSVWVLVAVTVGMNLMGVTGMLIFIPICSVVYALFREAVAQRLHKKGREVPFETLQQQESKAEAPEDEK